ncbi:MAG: tetratricopeptide repeat protein [Spirochaetes bacterium]|nr:tetratricopeptide repeat protein [Spirochaetota bacterium]
MPRNDELMNELNELAVLHELTGNFSKSLHYYQLTIKAAQKYNDSRQEALAGNSIGATYFNLNRYDEALNAYRSSLDIASKKGYNDISVLILDNMATIYRVKKDYSGALERYREALSAAKKTGNDFNLSVITSNIGTMYFFKGDLDRALEHYSSAIDMDHAQGRDEYLTVDLSNIGSVYAAKGRYGEALNYFEKALEIDSKMKNENNIASRLNRIGDIFFRVGENNRAIENYNRSMEINTRLNNMINVAQLQSSLGRVYESMGEYDRALDHYIKALSLNKELEQQENISHRLSDIGLLYETRERHGEAVDFLSKALLMDMMGNKKNRIAYNLSNIGRVMISLKSYERALDYFRQSMEIYRELGDTLSIADDLKYCGIVHYQQKDFNKAAGYLSKALITLGTISRKNDLAFGEVEKDVYQWLTATYVKAGRPDRAYENNEEFCMAKMRAFLPDSLPGKQARPIAIDDVRKRIGTKSAAVVFTNMQWDNSFLIYIDSNSSGGYELDKAASVNAIYNARGKEIEKFMGERKTDIIFKLRQKSRHDYYYIEFEKIINYYRNLLSKKYIATDEFENVKYLGKAIYRLLFQKIERNIADKDELIIQPDGALASIPFETLIMPDGRFMAEKFRIIYRYSLTVGHVTPEKDTGAGRKSIIAFGGITPPPPPSKKNIESVRHFELITEAALKKIRNGAKLQDIFGFFGIEGFGAVSAGVTEIGGIRSIRPDLNLVTGGAACESAIKKMSKTGRLASYRVIHFSSRGTVIPEMPQLGVLTVSYRDNDGPGNEGLLNAREIAGLNISPDLVHIAELYVPLAGYSRGEGIWSLCRPFIEAGARGVSISFWPVDDAARTAFMTQVYRLAFQKGMPFPSAFAQARKDFIQGKISIESSQRKADEIRGGYTNPYYWGSFIYYGY